MLESSIPRVSSERREDQMFRLLAAAELLGNNHPLVSHFREVWQRLFQQEALRGVTQTAAAEYDVVQANIDVMHALTDLSPADEEEIRRGILAGGDPLELLTERSLRCSAEEDAMWDAGDPRFDWSSVGGGTARS